MASYHKNQPITLTTVGTTLRFSHIYLYVQQEIVHVQTPQQLFLTAQRNRHRNQHTKNAYHPRQECIKHYEIGS